MDAFERDLQKLTHAINESKDPEVKKAFKNYLESFKASMQTYIQFMSLIEKFELPSMNQTDYVVKHEQKPEP